MYEAQGLYTCFVENKHWKNYSTLILNLNKWHKLQVNMLIFHNMATGQSLKWRTFGNPDVYWRIRMTLWIQEFSSKRKTIPALVLLGYSVLFKMVAFKMATWSGKSVFCPIINRLAWWWMMNILKNFRSLGMLFLIYSFILLKSKSELVKVKFYTHTVSFQKNGTCPSSN